MKSLFGGAAVATDDGRFVTADQMRIAEIIKDYDPDLSLVWIPPEKREGLIGVKPFAVQHKDGYIILYADECDHRILEKLWKADNSKNNILAVLDAHNAAIEAIKLKRQLDEMENRAEMARSIIKSPKVRYSAKINDKKVIFE